MQRRLIPQNTVQMGRPGTDQYSADLRGGSDEKSSDCYRQQQWHYERGE